VLGPVELVDEVDSTNRVLLDRARDGAPHGLVLVADHQSAGRGRLDRTWEAKPGAALLVSVLLRPRIPLDQVHLVTVAGAIAACYACAEIARVSVSLKWPNDVVVERDGVTWKLAGLLAESLISDQEVAAVVLGMGLNVLDLGLPEGAIALDTIGRGPVDRDALLRAWLDRLDPWFLQWDASRLLQRYRERCSTIGRTVQVDVGSEVIEGAAVDVDQVGRLLVDTPSGSRCFAVGDVRHVRSV
jgi:BirA family biotin operon repressor/biotin-[acetyl-CoA-carboxylase] ligase